MRSVSRTASDRFAVTGRGRRLHRHLVRGGLAERTKEDRVADLEVELACMGPGELACRLGAAREPDLDPAVEPQADDALDDRLVGLVPVLRTQDLDVMGTDELFAHPRRVTEEAHDER